MKVIWNFIMTCKVWPENRELPEKEQILVTAVFPSEEAFRSFVESSHFKEVIKEVIWAIAEEKGCLKAGWR